MDILHTAYTIELYKGTRFIGYPQGTPPLSICLEDVTGFKLYRMEFTTRPGSEQFVEITRGFWRFQQLWLVRRAFMRRVNWWLRSREVGRASLVLNLTDIYGHLRLARSPGGRR